MGSTPKTPKAPVPDPATQTTSTTDFAKRRAELERRRRSGYSNFRSSSQQAVGSEQQLVG